MPVADTVSCGIAVIAWVCQHPRLMRLGGAMDADVEALLRALATRNAPLHWAEATVLVNRDAFARARDAGLLRHILQDTVLTQAGRAAVGAADYAAHDPVTWPAESRERLYLSGYCHVLALALHDLSGFPIVLLRDRRMKGRDGAAGVLHVFVEAPDSCCYDIDGLTSRARMLADTKAKSPVFQAIARDELAAFVGEYGHLVRYDEEDVTCARGVAVSLGLLGSHAPSLAEVRR